MAEKSFTVPDDGTETVYLRGYDLYDAVRVDFDSANSSSTSVDIEFKVDTNNDLDEVESNGFANMDATVDSYTGQDVSSGDPSYGTTSLARTVAVQITDTDADTGSTNAQGTVKLHNSSDPSKNADAFLEY